MLEIAKNLERIGAGSDPKILIAAAIAAILVGLFLWLGGLGQRKLLVIAVGAIGGGICAYFFVRQNPLHVAILGLVGAVVAVIFEREFITILAAAIAAVAGFAVLCDIYKINLNQGLEHACSALPVPAWIIVVALALVFIVGGFYLWRLTSALCCAFIGTLLVFVGMILLLSKKGAAPVDGIFERLAFYAVVFAGMVAFGTLVQLLFYKRPQKTASAKQPAQKEETKETVKKPASWRTQ